MAGLAVTTGFALLDVRRPVEQRGSLGRFLAQVSDGTSTLVVHRTGVDNVVTMATSPLPDHANLAAFGSLASTRPIQPRRSSDRSRSLFDVSLGNRMDARAA